MTYGSLFSGIGGMDLGLDRAGLECRWQVEIDPWCRKVLAKHWPEVRRHDDVRSFPPDDGTDWGVDVIAGGFPCQDISVAGKKAGLKGDRSGLWYEFARIIREVRPKIVIVENVSALLVRGLDTILGEMARSGFDAEWDSVSAASLGAPHQRDRIFIVAYAKGSRDVRFQMHRRPKPEATATQSEFWEANGTREWVTDGLGDRRIRWVPDSRICGVADGLPPRVDRCRALGNAVVPQVAERLGRRIMEASL